jgi:hypothetical protein
MEASDRQTVFVLEARRSAIWLKEELANAATRFLTKP